MEKYQQFLILLEELNVDSSVSQILQENGFDDWEQTKELTPQLLEQIGIVDPMIIRQILACIQAADSYDYKEQREEQKQVEEVKSSTPKLCMTEQKQQEKPITIKDILKGTSKVREKKITDDKYMSGIQVLSLNDNKFTMIASLQLCTNLKQLNLYNNKIRKIEGLETLVNLKQLYMDCNLITKIEGLDTLTNLEKLYLNKNAVKIVEGLQNQKNLIELQLNFQQIGQDEMTFEQESLDGIGESLRQFECKGNNIRNIAQLTALTNLQVLNLTNNNIDQFENVIEPLTKMKQLEELSLIGNPIAKIQKYRDRVVILTKSIVSLDGKQILPKEREFLIALWKKKHGQGDKKDGQNSQSNQNVKQVDGHKIPPIDPDSNFVKDPKVYQKLNSASDFNSCTQHNSTKHIPSKNQGVFKPFNKNIKQEKN